MAQIKVNLFKSVRMKLFITLSTAIVVIISILILLNNFVLESYYLHSKQNTLIEVYRNINAYYTNPSSNIDLELELEKIATNNNFDIIIKTDNGLNIYTSNKDFSSTVGTLTELESSATGVLIPKPYYIQTIK